MCVFAAGKLCGWEVGMKGGRDEGEIGHEGEMGMEEDGDEER